jgi:hypothetical protein
MTFSWDFPYPSRRMPVLARNVVATSQPLAAQAGLRMLLAGGNAVDAAIAAAVTLTVVEPTRNGIGGDVFAIVWDGKPSGAEQLRPVASLAAASPASGDARLRGFGHRARRGCSWRCRAGLENSLSLSFSGRPSPTPATALRYRLSRHGAGRTPRRFTRSLPRSTARSFRPAEPRRPATCSAARPRPIRSRPSQKAAKFTAD